MHVVAEMWVKIELVDAAIRCAATFDITSKDVNDPVLDFFSNLG